MKEEINSENLAQKTDMAEEKLQNGNMEPGIKEIGILLAKALISQTA
jgi:hypothetical protein